MKGRVKGSTPDHQHRIVTTRALGQRGGVPYEVERTICPECHVVLGERPLRRAAA
jgi:hypothetical protein